MTGACVHVTTGAGDHFPHLWLLVCTMGWCDDLADTSRHTWMRHALAPSFWVRSPVERDGIISSSCWIVCAGRKPCGLGRRGTDVTIKSRAGHAEQAADLAHRHASLRIEFASAGEFLGILHGGGAWPSPLTPTRAGGGQAGLRPLDDEGALELGERPE